MAKLEAKMSRYVLTISPEQTLEQAAQMMIERGVGSAVVTNNGDLKGIVTERDVLRSVARGLVPWNTKVSECMTADPVTVTADQEAEDAINAMISGGFRHLPVVEGSKLVGIVSLRDLSRAIYLPKAPMESAMSSDFPF